MATFINSTAMEQDALRVLELARTQRAEAAAASKRRGKVSCARVKSASRAAQAATTATRHRHVHSAPPKPASSLVQAKTQALMAVYGLRHAVPPQSAKKQAGDEQQHGEDAAAQVSAEKRQELVDARRRIYRSHFSGLQATFAPSGRPKLETLIDAAMEAKHRSAKHTVLAVGAAVLTSANRIYSSGRLESVQDAKFDVCAERAALLKVQQPGNQLGSAEVVEAMVICSDQRGLLPMPCGSCREFLAEFGDFPVFLLNAENDSQETRSFELFPHARHSTYTAMATSGASASDTNRRQRQQAGNQRSPARAPNHPVDVRDWTSEQVLEWLNDVVELPRYAPVFEDKRIDGATLWHLADSDLQLLLGIVHPLHRRRLLLHLDRIKDRELLDHGIDFGQLQDYVAVLDRDRMEVVAQLKETFDRLDVNRDGLLDFAELKHALQSLGLDGGSAQTAQQLLLSLGTGDSAVTFPVFVQAFTQLAQLPSSEVRDAGKSAIPSVNLVSLRQTFDKADADHSGLIDESELVGLLQSLGRDQCERRAREWFAAVDEDGDARLSFAEFFLRYAQLTKLDLSAVRAVFDAEHDGGAGGAKSRTVKALAKALQKLYPRVAPTDIQTWCSRRPWSGEDTPCSQSGRVSRAPVLSYADFTLACVMYGNALRLRVEQLRTMQRTLHNDPLCHRSRIVHLQQSGHVRLCKHPGEDTEGDRETVPLGERRRATTRSKKATHEREEKGADSDDDRHRIAATFQRFAIRPRNEENPRRSRRTSDSDDNGKQQHSSEEDQQSTLNAVEAAQALVELGIACSRDQLLRYLDREGFGLRRTIRELDFVRIYKRLQVFQEMPNGLDRKTTELRQRDLWEAIGHAGRDRQKDGTGQHSPPQKHSNRRDYDEFLRTKHRQQRGCLDGGVTKSNNERKQRSRELTRERRSRSRRRRSFSSSSSSSSSSPSSRYRGRGRHRRDARSQSRRCSSSSTSTASSSSNESRLRRGRSSGQTFRGFEAGDRVTCRTRGAGTLVRIYRDFFVADVRFDDGCSAKNVGLSHLRRLSDSENAKLRASDSAKREALVVGANVRVSYKGTNAASRRGTILRRRTDGTFDVVANECGEQELLQRVPITQILLTRKPIVYNSGARVTVKRKHEYLRGTVAVCRTNGTYDVRVKAKGTSSEVLSKLPWELLAPDEDNADNAEDEDDDEEDADGSDRHKETKRAARRNPDDDEEGKHGDNDDDDAFEFEFSVGDRVEARFQGQQAYYGGRITRVHSDGSCNVAYDDGDSETRVRASFIRAKPGTTTKAIRPTKPSDGYDDDDFESD